MDGIPSEDKPIRGESQYTLIDLSPKFETDEVCAFSHGPEKTGAMLKHSDISLSQYRGLIP